MKRILLIKAFLLFYFNTLSGQGVGYFTLKGNQFYDGSGQSFFPKVMPYGVIICHYDYDEKTPSAARLASDYFIAPSDGFGSTNDFECLTPSICLNDYIYTDFLKIQSMGFNTIRFTGGVLPIWNPQILVDNNGGVPPDKFYLRTRRNCDQTLHPNDPSNDCWTADDYLELNPFVGDPVFDKLISSLNSVINMATSTPFNFKVILEFGLGMSKTPAGDAAYKNLLAAFGDAFGTNTNITHFIIQSEPQFSDNPNVTKAQACSLTTGWYDMLKQHAPNHLISIAVEDGGIFNWDPMVLKCDFFEPHPYPVLKNYEKDAAANGYNVYAAGLNQMLGKFYWFKNFLPRPWMIGETGFKAIANPPNIYEYDGTLAEQSNYCNDAYTATVDCDGVGLSWWWYQDIFWPNAADGFGLMNHGDIVPYSLATFNLFDKPSVTTITNLNYSSLSPNVCNPPPNYSDPYNNAYFSTACPPGNIVTGTVTDVNGNPIEGAIVIGHTYTEWGHNNNSNIFFPIDNVSYTFTDASGYYELTPFDSKNPTVPARQYIRWIDCTALGAEPKKINDWGWWPDPSPPANEPPPPPAITGTQNFTLKTINTKINAIVQNVTINTSSVPYKAFKTLTATNNVIIQNGGSVDFVANNEVNIQTEFHAANGSEVHIYNERVFADCNEINSLGFRETGYSVTENLSSTKNPIEVSFIKAKTLETATVIPNPNNGTFDIIFNSENESKKEVMVYNATGSLILSRTFTESKMEMDLTLLAKGIYFIKIKTELSSFHQKIIIQ